MRWISYFILAYFMLGLQLGLRAHVDYRGVGPDLVLLVVIFISLNAPRDEALLGSFLLGAMQDLVNLQPMGLYAFSYGLVAMIVSSAGQLAYREHPLTQLFMTLLGGIVTGLVLLIHGWIHLVGPARTVGDLVIPAARMSVRTIALQVVYTAVLAPIVLGVLQRMQKLFGFEASARRRMRM